MITVTPVGGAKKSLGENDILFEAGITVSELLDSLAASVLDGAPSLDTANMLVAVNGADSSALGGRDTVLRDGDRVSIIPVIHGGAQSTMLRLAGRTALAAAARAPDLDLLRARHRRAAIQTISDRYVLNRYHLERILYLSLTSKRRGLLLSNKIETDILMRLALTRQISSAISSAGARPGSPCIVVALGPGRALESVRRDLVPGAPLFSRDNSSFLARRFGITKTRIRATRSRRPLEDLLAERAAVL